MQILTVGGAGEIGGGIRSFISTSAEAVYGRAVLPPVTETHQCHGGEARKPSIEGENALSFYCCLGPALTKLKEETKP